MIRIDLIKKWTLNNVLKIMEEEQSWKRYQWEQSPGGAVVWDLACNSSAKPAVKLLGILGAGFKHDHY